MKKIGLLTACLVAATAASADTTTETLLNVVTPNGIKKAFNIQAIDRITFEGEMMQVYTTDGMEELDLDAIEEMTFEIVSGVEEIRDFNLGDDLEVKINRGVLTALLPEGDLTLRVYTVNGQAVETVKSHGELVYSLTELPKGTYILLVNEKAIKFIR